MAYEDPPEWHGRGARDRAGWPNETFQETPGGPRSHRATEAEMRAGRAPVTQRPERRADTSESRPSRAPYHEEMPTDPAIAYRPGGPVRAPRVEMVVPADPEPQTPEVQHVILPIPRSDDPVERFDRWLRVAVHILGIFVLLAALWCLGMVIADKGVPLWVPRS
jgi:hypothetical protein